jgi:hypothetical protein
MAETQCYTISLSYYSECINIHYWFELHISQSYTSTNIMDRVLAKSADLCCLKGDIHTGEPTGTIEQIEGIDTYVATPEPSKSNGNVLLFFPDAFGLHINSFLMMDAFAACGYLTLGIDYFLGVRATDHLLTQRRC